LNPNSESGLGDSSCEPGGLEHYAVLPMKTHCCARFSGQIRRIGRVMMANPRKKFRQSLARHLTEKI